MTMFNIFKKKIGGKPSPVELAIAEEAKPKVKVSSQDKLVQEIHDTFMTEVDKLLSYAKVTLSPETQLQAVIEKADKLKKLGFTKVSDVEEATKETKRISDI